jgi:Predicted membrane-associated HD superfamily hydrolase
MVTGTTFSLFAILPMIMIIVYGLFILMGLYALYLFIKLMIRGIAALDIYLDEKRNGRF